MNQTKIPTTPSDPQSPDGFNRFVEASGCLHIVRSFRMAIEPRALGIALVAIIATFVLGLALDAVYLGMGGGVSVDVIDRFIANPSAVASESDEASLIAASKKDGEAAGQSPARADGVIKKRPSGPREVPLTPEQIKDPVARKKRDEARAAEAAARRVEFLRDVGLPAGPPAVKEKVESEQSPVGDEATHGVFEVWRKHERSAVLGLLTSPIPGTSVAAGSPIAGPFVEAHTRFSPSENLARIFGGLCWFFQYHPVYFLVFFVASLAIWSIAGGAICRIAAVQFARNETLSHRKALAFAWENRSALFFAPCVPVAFLALLAVGVMLIGALLRLPLFDVLSAVLFPLSLLIGALLTWTAIGLAVGGSMFWPAVATDGVGAFDAFARAFGYTLPRPWKAIQYAIITLVYAGFCCVFVNVFLLVSLWTTRALTGMGGSWFGAWPRDGESKMDLLWPTGGGTLYAWPANLAWHEYPAAIFVGLFVLLVFGMLWAFLASLFFSSSTIGYFLLRRDVDGTDLSEIQWASDDLDGLPVESVAEPQAVGTDIPLPTINEQAS